MNEECCGLREFVEGIPLEELRDVLCALEGRIVDVAAVQDSLAKVRSQQPPSRTTGSFEPLPAATPITRRAETEAMTASAKSGPSPSAPATKRARCEDAPLSPPSAAAAVRSSAAMAVAKTANVSSAAASSLSSPAAAAAGDGESGSRAGFAAPVRNTKEESPSCDELGSDSAVTATATKTSGASQLPVPPQGPRGLSWKEKQRDKSKAAAAAAEKAGGGGGSKKKQRKKGRDFDHSRWRKRMVAVQLMYEGGNYAGFCSQSDGNEDTVEKQLFQALSTTKLAENITTGDNYSRCGRTDRGVSALGNVVTILMRSKFPKHVPDEKLPTTPLGTLWVAPIKAHEAAAAAETTGQGEGETVQPVGGSGKEAAADSDAATAAATAAERGAAGLGTRPAGSGENERVLGGQSGGQSGGRGNGHTHHERKAKRKKHPKKGHLGGGAGGARTPAAAGGEVTEMDYCGILNRVLPPDVRALAWAPVTEGFSARFSCSDRTYRYFFVARDMDIEAMDEAASKIVGNHDFRNLCKIDVANVSNFVRHIKHASVRPVQTPTAIPECSGSDFHRVCVFEVCGQAFLWHMVRCLMAVLFMVGKGLESPDVMSFLMDIERCRGKPHYDMAPEGPLLLHDCRFRSLDFQYTPENLYSLQSHLETLWEAAAIKAARLLNNLEYLAAVRVSAKDLEAFAAFKRALKSPNTEHYSVVDHGEQGRRRQFEQKKGRDQQQRRGPLEQQQQEADGDEERRRRGQLEEGQRQQDGDGGDEEADARGEEAAAKSSNDVSLTWREVLGRLRSEGLGPGQLAGRKGHMPMVRRQQGLHYDELVEGLGGKKRERLDRHLAMKAAGEESGETAAFYNAAAKQGVPHTSATGGGHCA